MSSLAILTPSYGPDLELCRDLNRSVLEFTPSEVHHHVIVPLRDRELFSILRGPRTEIWTVDELIAPRMVAVPRANLWLNLRRPYPPVRGWVMQQLVKLRAAVELSADVVVLADSDVVFARPVTVDTFRPDGRVLFYRNPDAIDVSMGRHVKWHAAARRLLGLDPAPPPPLTDYISAFNVWDRRIVAALRHRIELINGRPWLDVIASELQISEFILYGVFVESVLGAAAEVDKTDSMLCHSYWDPVPLSAAAAAEFVDQRPPEDVAVMISAKSRTTLDVRRSALSRIRVAAPMR